VLWQHVPICDRWTWMIELLVQTLTKWSADGVSRCTVVASSFCICASGIGWMCESIGGNCHTSMKVIFFFSFCLSLKNCDVSDEQLK